MRPIQSAALLATWAIAAASCAAAAPNNPFDRHAGGAGECRARPGRRHVQACPELQSDRQDPRTAGRRPGAVRCGPRDECRERELHPAARRHVRAGLEDTVDLRTLTSDRSQRDQFIQRNPLETAKFPNAKLVPKRTTGLALPLATSGDLTFTIAGSMMIHDTPKDVTLDVTAKRAGPI